MIVKPTESRLEIALKVFQWSPNVADLTRVSKELELTCYEFNTISDEEFFQELFMYFHNRDSLICS